MSAKPTRRSGTPCATAFHAACRTAANRVKATTSPDRPDGATVETVATRRLLASGPPGGGHVETEPSGFLSRQVSAAGGAGRPWRRSVQTPATLVVGQATGSGRNPRRKRPGRYRLTAPAAGPPRPGVPPARGPRPRRRRPG